jgi:predicted O-methyltransferase YrrM
MKLDFRRRTEKLRHGIVKLIAPKVYVGYLNMVNANSVIVATPRPMTLFLKQYFKNSEPLTAVEIGVAKADNSLSILQELPIKKLILIDPYGTCVENGRLTNFEGDFETAMARLSSYKQAQFIRKTSEEAAKDIDEPLDFVYIDGNHSYEYVKQDIANYYPLVKQGGIIGGHDYFPYPRTGVCQAVNEFVQQRGRIEFYAVFPDWWIIKP